MAGAAEQISQLPNYQAIDEPPLWLVPPLEIDQPVLTLLVPELAQEVFTRHQAARFIGQVALQPTVETQPDESDQIGSLYEALPLAQKGDARALRLVYENAGSDVIERTIKVGHIMEVELEVDDQSNISQHGQPMEAIQANTLIYATGQPAMRQRSEAEVRNSFRFKNLYRQQLLEDYAVVVFSRAADDMTKDEMTDAGFFTDTMSCAIQLTTAGDSGLVMESAFVAGVSAPGAARHDQAAVAGVMARLGVEMPEMSATELLDTPVLIHKSLLPNGVIDLVKLYDEAAGGTFFGETKPAEDYLAYRAKCQQRAAGFAPKVAVIVAELIAEAPLIKTPVEAIQRLHKIAEKHMVEQAVVDNSINPLVFGRVAANHIEQARAYQDLGQTSQAKAATVKAQATAKSSSCPSAVKLAAEGAGDEAGSEGNDSKVSTGKKERMTCPFCGDKNQSGDPCSPNQHCNNCHARVVGGKVVSRGNGGKKAVSGSPTPNQPATPPKIKDAILLEEKRRQTVDQAVTKPEQATPAHQQPESRLGKLAVAA